MQLRLVAVGRRMPAWVEAGVREYVGRFPPEMGFELVELALGQRSKSEDPAKAIRDEGTRMLAQIPDRARVIALDERGKQWSTRELARELDSWRLDARPVTFLVGGPDGLSDECKMRAERMWALSSLTLPHGMVRVLLAEQLYRAWSILSNHPYHRD